MPIGILLFRFLSKTPLIRHRYIFNNDKVGHKLGKCLKRNDYINNYIYNYIYIHISVVVISHRFDKGFFHISHHIISHQKCGDNVI